MTEHDPVLDAILKNIRDAVVVAGGDHRPTLVNAAFERLTGHAANAFLDRVGVAAAAYAAIVEALARSGDGPRPLRLPCGDGSVLKAELAVSAISGGAHYLGLLRPAAVSGEGAGGQKFGHDALTGLPNRDIFMDRVERAVVQVNRAGGSVALLMMGLDHFTRINDALGHRAGDQLLSEVARRLRACIREIDTAVRLEGDKFALVMAIASMDDSVIVAEKVLAAVKEPFAIDGQEVVVTFSIGIALYPQDADGAEALVKQAENALHHAKSSGRNRYQFFSRDMNNKARSRLDLEARMRRALVNQEYVVFYQPKVSAENNRIVGAEALIRWIDPEKGMINPGEFIPVAEETGLIEAIGTWVLRRSCQQVREWQDQGVEVVKVSVNVSARQFRSRALLDIVTGVLKETGLDPCWLELEITESMLMNDVEAAVKKMNALRALGIGLSIDDFGTGYSSLSYLGRFPITTLKIDRAFIADVDHNPKTAEIARAIIGLSRGLNLEVVAEGCEIAAHIRFLKDNGCDTVQGFYYSRPVPADTFRAMLVDGFLSGQGEAPGS